MKSKATIIARAEDIHFRLLDIEELVEKAETDLGKSIDLPDEHFDLTIDMAHLMRDLVDLKLQEEISENKSKKSYFYIPGATDFYSGEIGKVEIDPGIAEAVKIFNEKGYTSYASCSGHTNQSGCVGGVSSGYLWIIAKPRKELPRGFKWDKPSNKDMLGVIIRWRPRTEVGLDEALVSLLDYSKSIKPRKT